MRASEPAGIRLANPRVPRPVQKGGRHDGTSTADGRLGRVGDLHATDPAAAEPVWSALDSVQNGLGGGNEIAGGVWVLLISWAALQTGALPRWLNYLGLMAGLAGLVTVIPPLEAVGAVFGIGLIVWFVGVGVVLLREQNPNQATSSPTIQGRR